MWSRPNADLKQNANDTFRTPLSEYRPIHRPTIKQCCRLNDPQFIGRITVKSRCPVIAPYSGRLFNLFKTWEQKDCRFRIANRPLEPLFNRQYMKPQARRRIIMKMPDLTYEPANKAAHKPIPLGLAIGLLGLFLLVGLGFIWKYVYRAPRPPNAIHVLTPPSGNPRVAGGPVAGDEAAKVNILQSAAEAELPDGVRPGPAGDTLFKGGDAYARFEGERSSFGFFTVKDGEWEHGYLTLGVRHILAAEDFAAEIKVTAGQRERLEKLPAAPPAKWPQEDRDRFIAQYKMWAAATGDDKVKAGDELVKTLKTYGEQKRVADQKIMAERVAQIRAILNEKQLARINPIPKWDIKTTQPAVKP
jgi:hypothetical protein